MDLYNAFMKALLFVYDDKQPFGLAVQRPNKNTWIVELSINAQVTYRAVEDSAERALYRVATRWLASSYVRPVTPIDELNTFLCSKVK